MPQSRRRRSTPMRWAKSNARSPNEWHRNCQTNGIPGNILTWELLIVRADADLLDWLRVMSNERFRRLPVVDQNDRIVAIMTQGDFVSYTWPDLIDQAKQVTKATISTNYQIMLVAGGILLYYSIVLIAILLA
ncbi:CBS domain-containing protein [Aurantimonas aggregata]